MTSKLTALQMITIAGFIIPLSVGGCASRPAPIPEPTIADRMERTAQTFADEADARMALADRWREGDQMISAGERQQADALETIEKANRAVDRAEREIEKQQDRLAKAQQSLASANSAYASGAQKIADGQRLKAEAEAEFRTAYPAAVIGK